MNVGNFIVTIFDSLISLVHVLYDFLTTTFTVGETEVSVLGLLAGVGITIGIIWSVVTN